MNQQITVNITSNYGQEAIYPTNENGDNILKLTGKKTLSRNDINVLKSLGYAIVVEQSVL